MYGFRGTTYARFRDYLSGRKQVVNLNGLISSDICRIVMGIPQGSILGPILCFCSLMACQIV